MDADASRGAACRAQPEDARRFRAVVEYDGTDFAGFQRQRDVRTVQGALEAAIKVRTGCDVDVTGAGRTDAGVHALGQVVSFRVATSIPTDRMAIALNSVLPPDVAVHNIEETDERFSARFSASSRVYLYAIFNDRARSPLLRRFTAFVPDQLNVDAMGAAARLLLGENNFGAFANELEPGKSTHRDVMRCRVRRRRQLVIVRIEANAFLRGMVRTIVGTLIEVGLGRRESADLTRLLSVGDRRQAGFTAPAQGLCLLHVRYGVRKAYGRSPAVTDDIEE